MAGPFNVLAQVAPVAALETLLVTAPASQKLLAQQLAICNRGAGAAQVRVSVSLLGVATTVKDYLYFDLPVQGNDTFASELSLTLNAADTIRVYSSTGLVSFTLFGQKT